MSAIDNPIYSNKTYAELSVEFRKLYPTAIAAFQLIPKMYIRLTEVDGLSHKAALRKMREDHMDLKGFSGRNIRRYLPSDNPNIPKRIRPPRPNSIGAVSNNRPKLSTAKIFPEEGLPQVSETFNGECPDCNLRILEIQELKDALEKCSDFKTADMRLTATAQAKKEFKILVDIDDIQDYIQNRPTTSGLHQLLINVYLEIDTGKVLSVSLGKHGDP